MGRSPGFGSTARDWTPFSDSLSLRLRLYRLNLATDSNSQAHYAKGTRSAHSPKGIVLPLLVDTRFQVLFTPLAGVLFTFPSRYWFTIGRQVVFSLGRWSSQIPTGLHVSRGTQEPLRDLIAFRLRGYHPLWPAFPDVRLRTDSLTRRCYAKRPHNPATAYVHIGLGYSPFARHY